MKQRYIDFVPTTRKVTKTVTTGVTTPRTASRSPRVVTDIKTTTTETSVARGGFSITEKPELGVIDVLNAKFVKTEVSKRPLSRGHFNVKKDEVTAVKAEKVGNKAGRSIGKRATTGSTAGTVSAAGAVSAATKVGVKKTSESTYIPPRGKFISQAKVEKRPLSKNVYTKKVVVPKEEPKGPVTIITKPEKQNHAGLIVTIILTIILGAAAGTVAFLLLPK